MASSAKSEDTGKNVNNSENQASGSQSKVILKEKENVELVKISVMEEEDDEEGL